MTMSRVAVALVTHQGEQWLDAVLGSIEGQRRQVDEIVVVDDHSTDGTHDILRAHGITWLTAESTLTDTRARTGQNFAQAAREAGRRCSLIALADQDDLWHPNRIAHQAWCMDEDDQVAMFASDGALVDDTGHPMEQPPRSLREAFPLPEGWYHLNPAAQFTATLHRSIATGSASMLRPARLEGAFEVPQGWLHDRWWSIAAVAMGRFQADGERVIDYRVSSTQQVGLDRGSQGRGSLARLADAALAPARLITRLGDVQELKPLAAPGVAEVMTTSAVLRGFLGR